MRALRTSLSRRVGEGASGPGSQPRPLLPGASTSGAVRSRAWCPVGPGHVPAPRLRLLPLRPGAGASVGCPEAGVLWHQGQHDEGMLQEGWGESRCSRSLSTQRAPLPLARLPLDLCPPTSKPGSCHLGPAPTLQPRPAMPQPGRGWGGSQPPAPPPRSWLSTGGLSGEDAPGFQAPWPGGHVAGLEQAPSLCQQRLGGDQASVQRRGSPHRGAACPPRPRAAHSLCVCQAVMLGTNLRLQPELDVEKVSVFLM